MSLNSNNIPLKISLYGLIILIVSIPFYFGGNRPTPIALSAICASLMLLVWTVTILKDKRNILIPIKATYITTLPFLLVLLWALLQNIVPPTSDITTKIWEITSKTLDKDLYPTITLDSYKSIFGLMKLLTYGVVFWVAMQLGRNKSNAKIILFSIILAQILYAFYGLFNYQMEVYKVLWLDKVAYKSSLSSTFINRNSYATYVGLGVIIVAAYFFNSLKNNLGKIRIKKYISNLIDSFIKRGAYYLIILVILSIALIFSNSRAGVLCSILGFITLCVLFATSKNKKSTKLIVSVVLLPLIFVGILITMNGQLLVGRLFNIEQDLSIRLGMYSIIFDVIKNSPITGYGLGSFEDIFAIYKDTRLKDVYHTKTFSAAHNTYLEAIVELGIPAFLLLCVSIGSAIYRCFKGVLNRKRNKIYPLIAVACSVLVWCHALFDFSIQIPSVAITYAAILGVGYAQSWSTKVNFNGKKKRED